MRILNSCVAGLPICFFFGARFWNSGCFLNTFGFFGNKKARKFLLFLAYFQSDRLGSSKKLSELHIHYKSLATRVYYHAGCTKYCKNFTVALKMIYVTDKKQIHDSVITGKEYASEDWTCVISIFLTSFNDYFMCGCACFMCICLKTAICFFWDKVWLFLVKTGWQLCCVVWQDSILQTGVCARQSSRTLSVLHCSYSTRHRRSLILQL